MYEIIITDWGKKAQEKISVDEYQSFVQQHSYKKYAKTFSLSPETIENLQSLMISKEDYIKNIE